MREDLLGIGVSSLSKAGTADNRFAGHFGATLIAGYCLLNDFGLEPRVTRLIEARLDRTVEIFDGFFPPPEPPGQPVAASAILQRLASLVLIVANSGHGVIYGSLALRAMQVDPSLRTERACQNVAALMASAAQHDPGRYYGVDDPASVQIPADALSEACSLDELTRAAIAECELVYPDEEIDGRRHFFNGEKIHGVTYAQALADLDALGHSSLAEKGRESLRRQLYLSRQQPPDAPARAPR